MAGSRGMVTSLMDTAHKTDTECHEAAITAFTLTNYIAGRMTQWHLDSSSAFHLCEREADSVISTGKEIEGPL